MRFPSGVCGVVIVVFALMGSIGVGFLLNGSTQPVTVNDYEYVTDVSGLYSYTPVKAYSDYSPAQNNYQYSTSQSTLGTYTSGITYTQATAANLNPIITPSSGIHTETVTVNVADLPSTTYNGDISYYVVTDSGAQGAQLEPITVKLVALSDILSSIGSYSSAVIHFATVSNTSSYSNTTFNIQLMGIYAADIEGSASSMLHSIVDSNATVGGKIYRPGIGEILTTACDPFTYPTTAIGPGGTMSNVVGKINNFTVAGNGIATYDYTYNGTVTQVTKSVADVTLAILSSANWSQGVGTIGVTKTYMENITYLDPNYGVSPSSNVVYWSNDYSNGAVSWLFQKPTAATAYVFVAQSNWDNAWIISWSPADGWVLSYHAPGDTNNYVRKGLGGAWSAVRITEDYTGVLQAFPVKNFTNFTSYTVSPSVLKVQTAGGGNNGISFYEIICSQNDPVMRFACAGTTVESGTVPGAMYDGSFSAAVWFPEYPDVRISFDSAAYIGTQLVIRDWHMDTDVSTFTGTFEKGGRTYSVDLTKPWAFTYSATNNNITMSFSEPKKAGVKEVEILDYTPPGVNLYGQWVVDTDLYSVSTHLEDQYQANLGEWGLERSTFLVCCMGLILILAVAFKLAGVPVGLLDLIVMFGGVAIFWVVM